jgi:hypothetical protein
VSQPPPYTPSHSFISDVTTGTFPGQSLDVEFAAIEAVTDAIETNLAIIQRDDGQLANSSVGFDQLSPSLQSAGIAPANAWMTGTSYILGTPVVEAGVLYRCLVPHTSGVFATDLAAGDWVFVASLTAAFTAGANLTLTANVFSVSTSPHFTTPNIDVATATSVNGLAITAAAGATLAIAAGKTATFNNTTSFAGTDGTTQTFPGSSGTVVTSVTAAGGGLAGTYPNPTVASVPASALPNPTAATLGGVQSAAAVTHNWINSISTSGVPVLSQPAFTDISGSVVAAQMPALTGDVTTTAGAVATTISTGAVTNAKMANSASGWTYKGNPTASGAAQQDFTTGSLTLKSSPVGADSFIISDSAASGALKQTTLSDAIGALSSGVSSIDTQTGAFTTGNGIDSSGKVIELTAARRTLPTVQTLSGSGTYTTPANVLWIEVQMVGGGGGGGGGSNTGGAGSAGGASTFGTSLLVANGGSAGSLYGSGSSIGGTASGGQLNIAGQGGASSWAAGAGSSVAQGAGGGSSFYGGGGTGGWPGNTGGAGVAPGAGGGGGGGPSITNGGGGGGAAGGYCYAVITLPSATYSYAVGAGGGGGSAGAGSTGGAGLHGAITVIEHYGS